MIFRSIPLVLALLVAEPATAGEPKPPEGLYVAVGYGGRRICSRDGIAWEHDRRWSDVAADDDNVLFNVAFGRGKFVAVGGASVGHILTTVDGRTWAEVARPKGRVATVAFGDGRFVAGHGDRFLVSEDGESWADGVRLPIKGGIHPRKSAFGNGVFVTVGDYDYEYKYRTGFRSATADGRSVTAFHHHTSPTRAIAFGAGRFVVVGTDGHRESSADGKTWEHRADAPGEDLNSVVWTGSKFLAGGGQSAYSSPDGIAWSKEPKRAPCSALLARDGTFLGASWGGNLWRSADGAAWSKVPLPAGPSFEAVAFGLPDRR